MTKKGFATHTGIEVDVFRVTLLQLMGNVKEYIEERAQHILKYDDKVKACRVQSCDGIGNLGKHRMLGQLSRYTMELRLISLTLPAVQ